MGKMLWLDKVKHLDHKVIHNKMLQAVELLASWLKVQGTQLVETMAEGLVEKVEVT